MKIPYVIDNQTHRLAYVLKSLLFPSLSGLVSREVSTAQMNFQANCTRWDDIERRWRRVGRARRCLWRPLAVGGIRL